MNKKLKVYLAGRMSGDISTKQWREDLTPVLESLNFQVFNPFKFEPLQLKGLKLNMLPPGFNHWYELRDSEKPAHVERFNKYMRRIIRFDINMIKNEMDLVIVQWDKECRTGAGTHSELTTAFLEDIPVYCVNLDRIPAWAQACCDKIFTNFQDLETFLRKEYANEL